MEVEGYFVQTSPRALLYEFTEGQDHVRLVIASEDDTCATVSVQDNSVSRISSLNYVHLTVPLSIPKCRLFRFIISYSDTSISMSDTICCSNFLIKIFFAPQCLDEPSFLKLYKKVITQLRLLSNQGTGGHVRTQISIIP